MAFYQVMWHFYEYNVVVVCAKRVYNCKKQCQKLADILQTTALYLPQIDDNAVGGNKTCKVWMERLEAILEKGKGPVKKYEVTSPFKHAIKFWEWTLLPFQIEQVTEELEYVQKHVDLITIKVL